MVLILDALPVRQFFTRFDKLFKEKAKSNFEKIFSGFSKTRDNFAIISKLLLYWNLTETN